MSTASWSDDVDAFIRSVGECAARWDDHIGDLDDRAEVEPWTDPDRPDERLDAAYRAGIVPPESRTRGRDADLPDDAIGDPRGVTITFFRSAAADQKQQRGMSLPALAALIRTTRATAKDQLPWLKLARLGNARTAKGSLRHDRNMIAISGCEADYDAELVTVDRAVEVAEKAGLWAIIYTSPSHSPQRPRWRVLCPTSREYPPAARARFLGRLSGLYGGIFARESWTLSQSYYFGSVTGATEHRVEVIDGQPIDQLDELDLIAIGPPAAASVRLANGISDASEARDDAELIRRIVTGEGFHTELCALAARNIGRGLDPAAVAAMLQGLMLAHPEGARDARWHDRYESIAGLVASAREKFQPEAERRRRIARLTHRLVRQRRPGAEIRAAIVAEAAKVEINPEIAITIGAGILREHVGGQSHAQ